MHSEGAMTGSEGRTRPDFTGARSAEPRHPAAIVFPESDRPDRPRAGDAYATASVVSPGAGGRLVQPGDAQAEPLEAGGIRRAIGFHAAWADASRPERSSRVGRPRDRGTRGTQSRRDRPPRRLLLLLVPAHGARLLWRPSTTRRRGGASRRRASDGHPRLGVCQRTGADPHVCLSRV